MFTDRISSGHEESKNLIGLHTDTGIELFRSAKIKHNLIMNFALQTSFSNCGPASVNVIWNATNDVKHTPESLVEAFSHGLELSSGLTLQQCAEFSEKCAYDVS